MPYTTEAELIERYGEEELVQLSSDTNSIDSAVIDAAITDAGAEINGYLQGKYTLPLSETPDVIAKLARVLAYISLNRRRNIYTDEIKDLQRWATNLLDKIAKDTIKLPIDTSAEDYKRNIYLTSNDKRGW